MMKILLIIYCLLFIVPLAQAQSEKVYDCLPFEDSKGEKICTAYVVVCNDEKGRYAKCSDIGKNKGHIYKKIQKQCRNEKTGRLAKCPNGA